MERHSSRTTTPAKRVSWVSCLSWVSWSIASVASAQTADPMSQRIEERMRALQAEAASLAGESKTLMGDLRRLEIERDLAAERAAQADAHVAAARAELQAVAARLAALEQQHVDSLPDLQARFVELYKHGRGSYARMLAGVRDLREFGRATRAIASLVHLNQQRIDEHVHGGQIVLRHASCRM